MGGQRQLVFPQFLFLQDDSRLGKDEALIDTEFAAFFRQSTAMLPFPSSLTLHKDKQPDGDFQVHARTSPQAFHTADNGQLSPFDASGTKFRTFPKPQKKDQQQFDVVATVEGKLKSAFKDGVKSDKTCRVLVIASPQYFANPLARAANSTVDPMQMHGMQIPPDPQLAKLSLAYIQLGFEKQLLSTRNLIDWMSGEEDLNAVAAKLTSDPPLVYGDVSKASDSETDEQYAERQHDDKSSTRTVIMVVLILGIPALVALLGILRWRMRVHSRATASLA
jgi:hypothetical protein